MLSRSRLKQYQQLHSKKFRQKYGLFVVEGLKSVEELLSSDWKVEQVLCTSAFELESTEIQEDAISRIDENDFNKISGQKNPQGILAIVEQMELKRGDAIWEIALDRITDPGNLGTIMRVADWYGIETISCNTGSVDPFNPKVIQASMGSFLRVCIRQTSLDQYLLNKTVFAAVMNGQDIRKLPRQKGGVLLIGNEAQGLSAELLNKVNHTPVTISGAGRTESLNAAIATAICCDRLING